APVPSTWERISSLADPPLVVFSNLSEPAEHARLTAVAHRAFRIWGGPSRGFGPARYVVRVRSMKTSLGIWAFGAMATRFNPGGYKPELVGVSTVEKVGTAVAGLGDLV